MNTEAPDFSHITTLIFDMDGTLIEHTWRLDYICEVLFDQFADELQPVTREEFFACYWQKSEDMWYMMVDQVLDGDTAARYAYVNTLRTLNQNIDLADDILEAWIELVLKEAVPYEDTFDVLRQVRGNYVTGILTNGFIHLQRKKIAKYSFVDYVDFTLVSEEAGYHKPDERVFHEALKLAGDAKPHETLYIGDNLVADVTGAQNAGLTPIFMNAEDDLEPPEGVFKIRQLRELLPLLQL